MRGTGAENTPVSVYASHRGKLYTINWREGGITVLDTLTGKTSPLAVRNGSAPFRTLPEFWDDLRFARVEGELFAFTQLEDFGYQIYRIQDDHAIRISVPTQDVVSNLVFFGGAYYYLATGRPVHDNYRAPLNTSTIELWTSDGTDGGARKVTTLAGTVEGPRRSQAHLTAGRHALLIGYGLSTSGATYFQLYRPGQSLQAVNPVPDRHTQQTGYTAWAEPLNAVQATYHNGGFYFMGDPTSMWQTAGLLRIDETTGETQAIGEEAFEGYGAYNPFYPQFGRVSFAALDDALFLQVSNVRRGQRLFQIMPTAAGDTLSLLLSGQLPGPNIPLQVHEGNLWFGHATDEGHSGVYRYDPSEKTSQLVFTVPGEQDYDLFFGTDILYLVPVDKGNIYRYDDRTGGIDSFPADTYPRDDRGIFQTAALHGSSLVYTTHGYPTPNRYVSLTRILAPRDATDRLLLPRARPDLPDLFEIYGLLPEGNLVYSDIGVNGVQRFLYHAGTESFDTLTQLSWPSHVSSSRRLQFLDSPNRNEDYELKTWVGGGFVTLRNGRTGEPITVPSIGHLLAASRSSLLLVAQSHDAGTSIDLLSRSVGDTAGLSPLAVLPVPEITLREIDTFIVASTARPTADGRYAAIVLNRSGHAIDQLSFSENEVLLGYSPDGHFTFDHGDYPTAGAFNFTPHDGSAVRRIPLPPLLPFSNYKPPFQVGDKLLFLTYSAEHGNEFFVADPTTRKVSLLVDLFDGPGHGVLGEPTLANGILYFTGTEDGSSPRLWRTDGTPQGTYPIGEVIPRLTQNFRMHRPAATDTSLLFAGKGSRGVEIFELMLDGSDEVHLFADINPGLAGSYPSSLILTDDGLYVLAQPSPSSPKQLLHLTRDAVSSTTPSPSRARVTIYPNPATDVIRIATSEGRLPESVRMFDPWGREVASKELWGQSDHLNVRGLSTGHYLLVVKYASGERAAAHVGIVR